MTKAVLPHAVLPFSGMLTQIMVSKMNKDSGEGGGDEWTRTTDSRIFSPMLYQLSYITT